METFSALLALCAGNPPITGEFPSQRPVTWSFDVLFDLRLNKRLRKQSRRRWFETWLWRHCNGFAPCRVILWLGKGQFYQYPSGFLNWYWVNRTKQCLVNKWVWFIEGTSLYRNTNMATWFQQGIFFIINWQPVKDSNNHLAKIGNIHKQGYNCYLLFSIIDVMTLCSVGTMAPILLEKLCNLTCSK